MRPRDVMAGIAFSITVHMVLFWPGAGNREAVAAFEQGISAVRITLAPSPASVAAAAVSEPEREKMDPVEDPVEVPVEEPGETPMETPVDTPPGQEEKPLPVSPDGIMPAEWAAEAPPPPPEEPPERAAVQSEERDGSLEQKGVTAPVEMRGTCRPEYPKLSRKLGEQGTVTLAVTVGPDGQAQSIRVVQSSGFRRLDRSAQDALGQVAFQPARRLGVPVSSVREFEFSFRLEDPVL